MAQRSLCPARRWRRPRATRTRVSTSWRDLLLVKVSESDRPPRDVSTMPSTGTHRFTINSLCRCRRRMQTSIDVHAGGLDHFGPELSVSLDAGLGGGAPGPVDQKVLC